MLDQPRANFANSRQYLASSAELSACAEVKHDLVQVEKTTGVVPPVGP